MTGQVSTCRSHSIVMMVLACPTCSRTLWEHIERIQRRFG